MKLYLCINSYITNILPILISFISLHIAYFRFILSKRYRLLTFLLLYFTFFIYLFQENSLRNILNKIHCITSIYRCVCYFSEKNKSKRTRRQEIHRASQSVINNLSITQIMFIFLLLFILFVHQIKGVSLTDHNILKMLLLLQIYS